MTLATHEPPFLSYNSSLPTTSCRFRRSHRVDKRSSCDSHCNMSCAFKNSPAAWRTFSFLTLLAVVAPPLQCHTDSVSLSLDIVIIAQVKAQTAPPQQKGNGVVVSVAEVRDQTPQIDPSLLRNDFKQNLLVWPNVAGDLTRSPPSVAPVNRFLKSKFF